MEPAISHSLVPPLIVLVPLLGTVLAGALESRSRLGLLGAACFLTLLLVSSLLPAILDGTVVYSGTLPLTPAIALFLRVDPMGALFAMTVCGLFLLSFIYSTGHFGHNRQPARYFALFMLSQACLLGVAFSGNLMTLLVFYEIFSIAVYPLVIHEETAEAWRAGAKYVVYILIGSSLILVGVIFAVSLAGDQPFTPGGVLEADADRGLALAAFSCLVAGFGVKAALMPLHGWVPDVHPAAPAPFSALLSGVMVAAGSFGILRVVFEVFGPELARSLGVMPYLSAISGLSVVLAAVLAIGESNLKRRLAWSTISQMAYVVLAVSLLAERVTVGALVHITHHAFLKGALFFCAGLLASQAGIRTVEEMGGAARRMPLTMAAFTIAALGIVGVPPLSGFVSKWLLGLGMLDAGRPWALAVLLGGALLSAVYLWPLVYVAYFDRRPSGNADPRPTPPEAPSGPEGSVGMRAAVATASVLTILLGLAAAAPGLPLSLARLAAAAFFGGE
jgi:multicomponent Na+:H+ antiporter subunit D